MSAEVLAGFALSAGLGALGWAFKTNGEQSKQSARIDAQEKKIDYIVGRVDKIYDHLVAREADGGGSRKG